jgi:opacity protein-like surface antigen
MTPESPTTVANMFSASGGTINAKSLFMCAAWLTISCAEAQERSSSYELTPFAGYTVGGEFEDTPGGGSLKLGDDASLGLILDIRQSANTQWEFLYSQQATRADVTGLPIGAPAVDLNVRYIHGGGTYLGHGQQLRPFLAATIGATHFDPGLAGFDSETFFSFSIGAGVQFRSNERLGVRLEARGYGTVLQSDTNLFCETGPAANLCAIHSDGSLLWQVQGLAGIVFRF